MGVISTFWRSYSTKIQIAIAVIVLVLLVGGFFYIKHLRSEMETVELKNEQLVLELDQSEAEKMLLLKTVSESKTKISALDSLVTINAQKAAKAKRSLEDVLKEYKKLLDSNPQQAATVVIDTYNDYVRKLSCASGGGECED